MSYPDDQQTTRIGAGGYGREPYAAGEQKWIDPTAPAVGWQPPAVPTANGGWAVATVIFFWPLAFVAFSKALSVPTLLAQGRIPEAQAASDSVARLGKIALVCGLAIVIVAVILEVAVLHSLAASDNSLYSRTSY